MIETVLSFTVIFMLLGLSLVTHQVGYREGFRDGMTKAIQLYGAELPS